MNHTLTKRKHFPTPYRAFRNNFGNVVLETTQPHKSIVIAVMERDDLESNLANADFIVTACNAHEDHLKKFEEIKNCCLNGSENALDRAITLCLEALAKAGVRS